MSLGTRGVHVCYETSFLARAHTIHTPSHTEHASLGWVLVMTIMGMGSCFFRGVQCTIRDMGVYRIRMVDN